MQKPCGKESDAGLRDAELEALRQTASGLIQGAVFTATGGAPLTAVGKQCVHPEEKPMTAHSRFDMASVGKVFTAGCCAQLIAEGKVDPDAPFVNYLPEYCDRRAMSRSGTLRCM